MTLELFLLLYPLFTPETLVWELAFCFPGGVRVSQPPDIGGYYA